MKEILSRLFGGERLQAQETEDILLNITQGRYPDAQIASLLTVFQMRGITPDELIGFQNALLQTCIPADLSPYKPIDIVGTGGDGKNTFNISTCTCFVVAGAGYPVAKHGNYGATSVSGASNVMEQHGVRFTNDAERLKRSMDECRMAYLHAPLFHPPMKVVGPVRRSLQVRTIFNLLGPLINPCRPAHQLLGVADLAQMRLYTQVFRKLGQSFSVVCSLDRYDEISLTHEFKVSATAYERIYRPADLGLSPISPAELYGGDTPQEARRIFDDVLAGRSTKAQKQCVLANAAFAIHTIDSHREIDECLDIARESLESGAALHTLQRFITLNS